MENANQPQSQSADSALHFRPAKGFPIVMGGFVVFAGVASLLQAFWFGVYLPNERGGPSSESSTFYSLAITLTLVGCGFIILGIGSIALKKWARKILLAWGGC